MQLIPNAGSVGIKSMAVWAAIIFAALGILIHALPNAPTFIKDSLPVDNIVATWDWGSGIATAIGVYVGRIIQQGGLS